MKIKSTAGSKVLKLEVTESFWEQYLNYVKLMSKIEWHEDEVEIPQSLRDMFSQLRSVNPDIFRKPLGAWVVI